MAIQASFDRMHASTLAPRLWLVVAVGVALAAVELAAAELAGSALLAVDALYALATAGSTAVPLFAAGKPAEAATNARRAQLALMAILGLWTLLALLYQFFVHVPPTAELVAAVGLLALAANAACAYLLWPQQRHDAAARRAWLSLRTGLLGNAAVLVAALLVALLGSAAPDLIFAGIMLALLLPAYVPLLRDAWRELHSGTTP